MATATSSRLIIYFDPEQETDLEHLASNRADDLPADADGDASLCPGCGEPLTWHEQPCAAPIGQLTAEAAAAPVASPPPGGFAYALGHLVVPATQEQAHPVVWRGQLRERSLVTGLVHRINVYRLSDGFWDCYREEELRAA